MYFPVARLRLLRTSIVRAKMTASSPFCVLIILIVGCVINIAVARTVRAFFLVGAKADRVEAVQRLVEYPVLFRFYWLLVEVLQFPN